MAISFERALGMSETAFKLRAEKASVLASNLANADTPGYKARDLDFKSALSAQTGGDQTRLIMKSTNKGHMSLGGTGGNQAEILYRTPNQPSIDGNTVEEQVEHAEFMKNNLEFQATFTFLNGKFKGLTKAIKGE